MKKILVIDDDKELLNLVGSILTGEGYEVVLQNNADDIIHVIHSLAPDLILLDVMLGGVDGRDVCRNIKSHRHINSIPVIMLTATSDVRNLFENFVPDDFISKPFDIQQLLKTIKGHLSHSGKGKV